MRGSQGPHGKSLPWGIELALARGPPDRMKACTEHKHTDGRATGLRDHSGALTISRPGLVTLRHGVHKHVPGARRVVYTRSGLGPALQWAGV